MKISNSFSIFLDIDQSFEGIFLLNADWIPEIFSSMFSFDHFENFLHFFQFIINLNLNTKSHMTIERNNSSSFLFQKHFFSTVFLMKIFFFISLISASLRKFELEAKFDQSFLFYILIKINKTSQFIIQRKCALFWNRLQRKIGCIKSNRIYQNLSFLLLFHLLLPLFLMTFYNLKYFK